MYWFFLIISVYHTLFTTHVIRDYLR